MIRMLSSGPPPPPLLFDPQLEMVPALLNHSEVAVGSTGMRLALGQPGGRVEDVGGELIQKVKQLEAERKNLRKETQNHHQHIDHGLSTLQERISELEQSEFFTVLLQYIYL